MNTMEKMVGESTLIVDADGNPYQLFPKQAEVHAPVIPIRGVPSDTRLGATMAEMLSRHPRIPRTRYCDHFALWNGLESERGEVSNGQFGECKTGGAA